jgi:predicted lipoprotein
VNSDAVLDPVVKQYVDGVVLPTYLDLKNANAALFAAVQAFHKNPSNAAFENCAKAWLVSREPWESSEAFLYGPVADLGLDPNMDSWPLDQAGIVKVLNSQAWAELEWKGDFDEEDDDIASAQSLRGFHTLEFLIFRDGKARTLND